MIRRTTKGLNHTIYLYNLIFIIKRLVQNLLMLFKKCNLTFFNCVLCLGESLTFFPWLLFKLPNDRRRFKALFMGGKNCERISEKYLRFLVIFKLIYDFNIFLCLCNDWVNCFVFNLEISLEMGGSEWRVVTLKERKMYTLIWT